MERKYFLQIIWKCIVFINISIVNSNTPLQICPNGYTYYSDGLCYPIERTPNPSDKVSYTPRCPNGYTLYADGLCYPKLQQQCPFDKNNVKPVETSSPSTTTLPRCPDGFIFHTDGLCYPMKQQPCPFNKNNVTTVETPTTSPTTAHTQPPIELRELRCPEGSIMFENKCRKVTCTLGQYLKGVCLHAVCPTGLVWRGKKCQRPGYVTTILEIDNEFDNELKNKPITVKTSLKNKIINHTSSTTTAKPYTTQYLSNLTTSEKETCCDIVTPRICKLYRVKWLCINRRHQRCDSRICSAPIVHLKAPEIKYQHPVLVMPPNPQLETCETNNCYTNKFDCSGCASGTARNCSPYCYTYMCTNGTCHFVKLREYCTYYKNQTGCLPEDGCIWNWC